MIADSLSQKILTHLLLLYILIRNLFAFGHLNVHISERSRTRSIGIYLHILLRIGTFRSSHRILLLREILSQKFLRGTLRFLVLLLIVFIVAVKQLKVELLFGPTGFIIGTVYTSDRAPHLLSKRTIIIILC